MATTTPYNPPMADAGVQPALAIQKSSRPVMAISASHAVNDTYASFLSPLLPAFIANLALTKAEAGLLTVFFQGPSLLQPVIGHLADHRDLRLLVIIAPAVTAAAMSLLGIAPSYGILAFLLIIAGLSTAGVHAVGAPLVGDLSGRRLGRGMSIWMVSGELGYAVGATIIVTAVKLLTLQGTPWLMIGGFITSVAVYVALRRMPARARGAAVTQPIGLALRAMRPVLVPVGIIVVLRSFVDAAWSTYLPTFLTSQGVDLWLAGVALTVLEFAGVAGAMLAGPWSDRIGRQRILALVMFASPVCLFLFTGASGAFRIVALVAGGFTAFAALPVLMAIVQGGFPENRALASGIYMAVAFALRSGVVVLVGVLGDRFGLPAAFYISSIVGFLALPFILLLPWTDS